MTERPILFSAPMVRALLDGRKTQTRRIVKPRRRPSLFEVEEDGSAMWTDSYILDPGNAEWRLADNPYGVPGDVLWVKETWQAQEAFDLLSPTAIGITFEDELGGPDACPIRYLADGKCEGSVDLWQQSPPGKTRVSIHMPRWASRLSLRVTDVRVERLNEISEADARAEGFPIGGSYEPYEVPAIGSTADWNNYGRASFSLYWSELNGPDSWAANPWVWAVSFEVVR